jgi:Fe2+ transport system protein FeoA
VSETFRDPRAPIPFRDLPTGQWGRLCESASDRLIGRRLRDLGFVPGTRVLIVRRAPLGDPIEVEIRGYRICLRRSQIDGLWVSPEMGGDPR